jgi:hypothetical protein
MIPHPCAGHMAACDHCYSCDVVRKCCMAANSRDCDKSAPDVMVHQQSDRDALGPAAAGSASTRPSVADLLQAEGRSLRDGLTNSDTLPHMTSLLLQEYGHQQGAWIRHPLRAVMAPNNNQPALDGRSECAALPSSPIQLRPDLQTNTKSNHQARE